MKDGKAIRLLKHVPAVQIRFTNDDVPAIEQVPGSFHDKHSWTLVNAGNSTNVLQFAEVTFEDTIDISGLSVADLSLINQGAAIAYCRPTIVGFQEPFSMRVTTYISVNPIRGTFLERTLFGNSLASPSESQDWFLASSQTYTREVNQPGYVHKISEDNWGTGGIANTSRLFVKVFIRMDRQAIVDVAGGGALLPFQSAAGNVLTSPMTLAVSAVTAEMDAVQTAAAIYRGNDLQQTYDES